ncbi:MAG: hypothetical protein IT385_15690 [Deltaproteobacteria bacterium]|nr:hypothetical protein [Deltaproteobacteria bacterium]
MRRAPSIVALALVACGDGGALTRDAPGPGPEVRADVDAEADASSGEIDASDDGDAPEPDPCGAGCFACERDGCDPIVDLTVSRLGACALLASGQPVCWGQPSYGALGMGLHGLAHRPPFRVDDRPPLVALELAASHACGLDAAGDAWCWGATYHGVPAGDRRAHVAFEATGPRVEGARALALGPLGSACALVGDGVFCWGLRLDGVESDEVGASFASTPERVPDLIVSPDATLSVGAFSACVWDREADRLACFGANGRGQLGAGADAPGGLAPREVTRAWGASPIVALALGSHHACVVAGATLWCWGALDQITPEPVAVATDLPTVHALAAGRDLTCAIVGDAREVSCWGAPSPALGGVVELDASDGAICARTADEHVACWRADRGAVEIVYASDRPARCLVGDARLALGEDGPDGDCRACDDDGALAPCPLGCADGRCLSARALAAGDGHACALLDDGGLVCWGERSGFGDEAGVVAPLRVPDLPPLVAVTAGAAHTCGLDAAGLVHCRGDTPAPPVVADPRPGALDAGGRTTCAVTAAAEVACWGATLDRPDEPPVAAPYNVKLPDDFAPDRMTVGATVACVAERVGPLASSRVACWGLGDEGQLGRPDAAASPSAAIVPAVGLTGDVRDLAAGRAHVVLAPDGLATTAWGWGADTLGQLGGDAGTLTAPRQLRGGWQFNLEAVAAGDAFSCVLERTGRVTCFGSNAHGQLGPATARAASSTPVELVGLGPIAAIAAGARHACAVDHVGRVACWGDNRAGQLGGGVAGTDLAPEPRLVRLR